MKFDTYFGQIGQSSRGKRKRFGSNLVFTYQREEKIFTKINCPYEWTVKDVLRKLQGRFKSLTF